MRPGTTRAATRAAATRTGRQPRHPQRVAQAGGALDAPETAPVTVSRGDDGRAARPRHRRVEQLACDDRRRLLGQQHGHAVELRALALVHGHGEDGLVRRQPRRRDAAGRRRRRSRKHGGAAAPSRCGSSTITPTSPLNRSQLVVVARHHDRPADVERLAGADVAGAPRRCVSICWLTASTPRGPRRCAQRTRKRAQGGAGARGGARRAHRSP